MSWHFYRDFSQPQPNPFRRRLTRAERLESTALIVLLIAEAALLWWLIDSAQHL